MSNPSLCHLSLAAALMLGLFAPHPARAQDAQDQPAQAAPAAQAASDVDERTQILKSEEWRETKYWFNQWLSVQEIYNKDEVAQMRSSLDKQISTMSADELRDFLLEMEHKLSILLSDDAKNARAWIGRYLAAHAKMDRKELKKRLPDPAKMTAAQLDDWLRRFDEEHASTKETQAAVERLRAQQVQATRQTRAEQRKYAEKALDRASQSRSYYGSGSPRTVVQVPSRSNYAPRRPVYSGYRYLYYSGAGAW